MKNHYRKFAIVGTSCVGKTTLINKLENHLQLNYAEKQIAIVPEAARYYFENKNVSKPFSYFHQSRIQNLAMKLEQQIEKNTPDIIVCDRSVLDAIAYIKAQGTQHETEKLIKKVHTWLSTYTHFFLLDPVGIDYKTDSIRKELAKTRNSFHIAFLEVLQNLALPYTLVSGTELERFNKIEKLINTKIYE
jgi:predicted ATPase